MLLLKVNSNSTHCHRLLTIVFVTGFNMQSCIIPSPSGEPAPGQLPLSTITPIIIIIGIGSVIELLLVQCFSSKVVHFLIFNNWKHINS